MSRELTDYRRNLERLNELFPEKEMLSMADAARVWGCHRANIKKHVPFTDRRVSKATLARIMSGGEAK